MIAVVISQPERMKEMGSFIRELEAMRSSFAVICPSEKILPGEFTLDDHRIISYLTKSQFRRMNLQMKVDLLRANIILRLRRGSTLGTLLEKVAVVTLRTLRVLKSNVKKKAVSRLPIDSPPEESASKWLPPHRDQLLNALNELGSTDPIERIEIFDLQDLVAVQESFQSGTIEIQLR